MRSGIRFDPSARIDLGGLARRRVKVGASGPGEVGDGGDQGRWSLFLSAAERENTGVLGVSGHQGPGWIGSGSVTVYSELMKLALASDERPPVSVATMVQDALVHRFVRGVGQGSAERVGDALTYDVTLVHLCERLGIEHDLAGETAGPEARRRAEDAIAARLPSLAAELVRDAGISGAER